MIAFWKTQRNELSGIYVPITLRRCKKNAVSLQILVEIVRNLWKQMW